MTVGNARSAERALEIRELDHLDRCGGRALRRPIRLGDHHAGRFESTCTAVLAFSWSYKPAAAIQCPLLHQVPTDGGSHLVERRALQPRLVILEPRGDVGVSHLGHLGRDLLLDEGGAVDLSRSCVLVDQLVFHHLIDDRPARFVERLRELHPAEGAGGLLQSFLVHLRQGDGGRSHRRHDVRRARHRTLLGRGARTAAQEQGRDAHGRDQP